MIVSYYPIDIFLLDSQTKTADQVSVDLLYFSRNNWCYSSFNLRFSSFFFKISRKKMCFFVILVDIFHLYIGITNISKRISFDMYRFVSKSKHVKYIYRHLFSKNKHNGLTIDTNNSFSSVSFFLILILYF